MLLIYKPKAFESKPLVSFSIGLKVQVLHIGAHFYLFVFGHGFQGFYVGIREYCNTAIQVGVFAISDLHESLIIFQIAT